MYTGLIKSIITPIRFKNLIENTDSTSIQINTLVKTLMIKKFIEAGIYIKRKFNKNYYKYNNIARF